MFIGHLALGMGAKKYAPRTSLGLLIAAPMFADLLWPTLLLLGVESVRIDPGNTKQTPLDFVHYPWSHSLLMLCVWGGMIGGAFFLARRRRTDALIVALLVVSHWVLDFVSHRPDMPLVPWGGPKLGLSLWNLPALNALLEGVMFAAGVALYFRATRERDRTGRYAVIAFCTFLALAYIANLFGPPPPSVTTLAWGAQISWLLPVWAWWADRHRVPTLAAEVAPR
jgi:hypothetical protein